MAKKSFAGWNWIDFLLGRKRMLVTLVGGLLGYWISDSEAIAVVSGAVVEAGFALIRYYYKR